jgi:hypothetical protein
VARRAGLLDAAGRERAHRVGDDRDGGPRGLVVGELAGLRQDDRAGQETKRQHIRGHLTRLVGPEHQGAVVEDVPQGRMVDAPETFTAKNVLNRDLAWGSVHGGCAFRTESAGNS